MRYIITYQQLKAVLFSLLVGIIFFVAACDITSPTEGVKTILNTKTRTTTVSVIFVDSQTQKPVGFENDTSVEVQVKGTDSDKVIDLFNRAETTFTARNGFLSFALQDEIIPGKDADKVQFNIQADAPGYLTTAKSVSIDSSGGNPLEIKMVNKSGLPPGVTGITNSSAGKIINGTTDEPVTLGSTLKSEVDTYSSVLIPENSTITDQNGQPLGGELSADYFVFEGNKKSSIQSFPGGLSSDVINAPNNDEQLTFKPAGYLYLQIQDENNRQARNFLPPLEMSMTLSPETVDNHGTPISKGDEIEIWSFNEDEGAWTFESPAEIEESSQGNLQVEFEADHLSYWTAAWTGTTCNTGISLNLTGTGTQHKAKIFNTETDQFLGEEMSQQKNGNRIIELKDLPDNVEGRIELYDMAGEHKKTIEPIDLCSDTTRDLDLSNSEEITVTFNIFGICSNGGDVEVQPSFPAFYKPDTRSEWNSAGDVVDGELELTLPEPGLYNLGAYYEEVFYQEDFEITAEDDGSIIEKTIDLPQNICDGI